MLRVPVRVHDEFEGFEAVVLREVGHEGGEGVGRGRRVGEDFGEGGLFEAVGAGGGGEHGLFGLVVGVERVARGAATTAAGGVGARGEGEVEGWRAAGACAHRGC